MQASRGVFFIRVWLAALIAGGLPAAAETYPAPITVYTDRSNEPVDPNELKEAGPLGDTLIGKPGAPVTIIEYASLACPICRVFHGKVFPQLKKTYIDTGKVVFIYREFPIGKSAQAAAVVARCAPPKDYFRISERLLANFGKWAAQEIQADALYKLVQDTGLTRAQFDSCLANQPINEGIVWSKQRGRKLGVQGTPTFFINGQKVRGIMSFEEMQKLIEPHLASAKPA
jgi:protein-disulfide isomerase